ncbi:CD151 antigen [Daphnia magna]|uniref:CD151 antigen n=1 Tax=Daphnia magna TaxID=35525 RepID=UPI001403DD62|nr:CD151 antigen [Daphnia magna]XP_032784629.1 CD151 antigen [Daphnia magna]XP_032784630.1 CD151 antigen [Daphnia magna]
MPLDCGATVVKYVLCLFNFALFWAGAAVLGVGIWLAADQNSFLTLIKFTQAENVQNLVQPAVITQSAYLLIAAGAFIFIVSFLGYCGAVKESRVLLGLYGAFVLVIVALEITAGSLAATYQQEAEKEIKSYMMTALKEYYSTQQEADALTTSWNLMQGQLSCCGVNNFTDFVGTPWMKNQTAGHLLPVSCCKLRGKLIDFQPEDPLCMKSPTDGNSYRMKGCYSRIMEYFHSHMEIVIGVGVGLGVTQILGIVFAFCLCQAIDNDFIK